MDLRAQRLKGEKGSRGRYSLAFSLFPFSPNPGRPVAELKA